MMTTVETKIGDCIAQLRDEFLVVKKDRFSCHHVRLQHISDSCSAEGIPILTESLSAILGEAKTAWADHGVRAVWVDVPLRLSALIAPLADHKFEFHHVKAPGQVTLTAWLSSAPNNLPQYANHSVGVAGLVVRQEENKVLVIQERFYPIVNGMPYWKFPGGLADVGEDLGAVARRETLEETGLDTEFECVLCTRHLHHFRWDTSDLYVACLMRLKEPDTAEIRFDPGEIANCCWMDINEFVSRPNASPLNVHILRCYQEYRRTGVAIGGQPIESSSRGDAPMVYNALTDHLPDQGAKASL